MGKVLDSVKQGITKVGEATTEYVRDKIYRVERMVIDFEDTLLFRASSMILVTSGLVLLGVSVYFLFKEHFLLGNAGSFLILGLFLLLAGTIIYLIKRGRKK